MTKSIHLFPYSFPSAQTLLVVVAVLFLLPPDNFAQGVGDNSNWDDRFGWYGVTGSVFTIDAGDCDMYVGGEFTNQRTSTNNYVARWDGGTWTILGDGPIEGADGTIRSVTANGSDVYAAGSFASFDGVVVNGIARWNGTSWVAIGGGVRGDRHREFTVYDVIVFGSEVFIAGDFTFAGEAVANNIAHWNSFTREWRAIDNGVNGIVYDLELQGDWLYVGGEFTEAGGIDANNIVRYNLLTGEWQRFGTGVNARVNAITVEDKTIYAGGHFSKAGNADASYVASWDRAIDTWSSLGQGMNDIVYALELREEGLYAGGAFTTAGSSNANRIAFWNGSRWSSLGGGLDQTVYAIASCNLHLCAGGDFQNADGNQSPFFAQWDFSRWNILSSNESNGLNDESRAVAMVGNEGFYAGGTFTTAGAVTANHIAWWNGNGWDALAEGTDGPVNTLLVDGDSIYVAGEFNTAGSGRDSNVAIWNHRSKGWESMGVGVNGTLYAMASDDDFLYVGGDFTEAGETGAQNIARWNKQTGAWSSLSPGPNGAVHALEVIDGKLWVGGDFTRIGAMSFSYLATYTLATDSWDAVGGGTNGAVRAVAGADDGKIYVGGEFTEAGGKRVDHIAFYDGTDWQSMEDGLTEGVTTTTVSAIEIVGENVYIGGEFTLAGGFPVGYLVRWRGSWAPLASGVSGSLPSVKGLSANGSQMVVAGDFATAGEKPSVNIGIWTFPTLSVRDRSGIRRLELSAYPNPINALTRISVGGLSSSKASASLSVTIVDPLGREIASIYNGTLLQDRVHLQWDASSQPNGIYFAQVRLGDTREVLKLIVR